MVNHTFLVFLGHPVRKFRKRPGRSLDQVWYRAERNLGGWTIVAVSEVEVRY